MILSLAGLARGLSGGRLPMSEMALLKMRVRSSIAPGLVRALRMSDWGAGVGRWRYVRVAQHGMQDAMSGSQPRIEY